MGSNFSTFRGLVPGAIGDAADMNPLAMMSGFMQGNNPKCTAVSLPEINSNNQKTGRKTRYIANGDILQMDPCSFGGDYLCPNPGGGYRKGKVVVLSLSLVILKLAIKIKILQIYTH